MSPTRTSMASRDAAGAGSKRFIPRAAPWTAAIPFTPKRDDAHTVYLPQAIAHRGFNASWPENSMAAFEAAVRVGAHALETDLRLTADGVVVLSHDPSLMRCFGVDGLVSEWTWEKLSALKTRRTPSQPMARLADLLAWLAAEPARDSVWLMLDIKIADDAQAIMTALKELLDSVPSTRPWHQRVVLGCWNASYMQAAFATLPDYPVTHISASRSYSSHFRPIPNMGFSLLRFCLLGAGARFLRDARAQGAPTFAWTVNDPAWMEWLIRMNLPPPPGNHEQHHHRDNNNNNNNSNSNSNSHSAKTNSSSHIGTSTSGSGFQPGTPGVLTGFPVTLDGVISDNPQLFLQTCARIQDELNTPLSYVGDPATEPASLDALRAGLSSLGQSLLGSLFAGLASVILWYRGYADYFPDPEFFAQFKVMPGEDGDLS